MVQVLLRDVYIDEHITLLGFEKFACILTTCELTDW